MSLETRPTHHVTVSVAPTCQTFPDPDGLVIGGLTSSRPFSGAGDAQRAETRRKNVRVVKKTIAAPETPISAETYAKEGLPFFALYEEPSGIKGEFDVKTVAKIDAEKGLKRKRDDEDHKFATVSLNGAPLMTLPFRPVAVVEAEIRQAMEYMAELDSSSDENDIEDGDTEAEEDPSEDESSGV